MGQNDKNVRIKTLTKVLFLAGFAMLAVTVVITAQPAHRICSWITIALLGAAIIQVILYRINPDSFKEK